MAAFPENALTVQHQGIYIGPAHAVYEDDERDDDSADSCPSLVTSMLTGLATTLMQYGDWATVLAEIQSSATFLILDSGNGLYMSDGTRPLPTPEVECTVRAMLRAIAARYSFRISPKFAEELTPLIAIMHEQRRAYRVQAVVEAIRAIRKRHIGTVGKRLRKVVVVSDCVDYQRDIIDAIDGIEWKTEVMEVIVRCYELKNSVATLTNFIKHNSPHCDIEFNGECTVLVDTAVYPDLQYEAEYHSEQLSLDCKEVRALIRSSPWVDMDSLDYFYKYDRRGVEDTISPLIERAEPALIAAVGTTLRPMPSDVDDALLLARYPPLVKGPEGERLSHCWDRNKNGYAYYVYAGR